MDTFEVEANASETIKQALASIDDQSVKAELAAFVRFATEVGRLDGYKVFPTSARRIVSRIHANFGVVGKRAFLRAAIAYAAVNTARSQRFNELPECLRRHGHTHLHRVVSDQRLDCEWLDIDEDLFHKEFGIGSQRSYPAGAQLIDFRCGIPRSMVFKAGLSDLPSRIAASVQFGGFKPYFQIHTHTFNLDQFNPTGWEECYRGCAELYTLFPDSLGMFGSSWFYDPALSKISPRLQYLRDVPVSAGARLFYMETGGQAIDNSLSSSPTRRSLYEQNAYMPKSYLLVWRKTDQIKWATMR